MPDNNALIRSRHSASGRNVRAPVFSASVALVLAICSTLPAGAQEPEQPASATVLVPREHDVTFENYRLRSGETLDRLRLHYATLGAPHKGVHGQIDNAILVLHWTGNSGASLLTPEYMKSLFAEGQPLDAKRYYLIVPDNLGHGRSSKPSDGLRAHFPHYGYGDLVDLQHKLVSDTLGIRRLHAILGLSMGGMNAWQWAEAYPDEVEGVMPVVSLPVRVSGRNLLWRRIVIDGIRSDPEWRDGDYARPTRGFIEGYRVLRMMIEGVPHLQQLLPDTKATEDYLGAIDASGATSDANDLLYSLESSSDYDPEPGLAGIKAKVLALNFTDDQFNPDELQILQTRIEQVKGGRYVVQEGGPDSYGHLTMAHPALWAAHVGDFMRQLEE
jgi:homoserine O-acetyltransferase/O-succinyltransferase